VLLTAAGHAGGWPVAVGGSATITSALTSLLVSLGGKLTTGVEVRSMADLPTCEVVLFDTSPHAATRIIGDRLPRGVKRSLERWRYGPAAWKVDLAVEGGIPWTAEACQLAGTVHVGGTMAEIARAEADVAAGRAADRPFVLVAQQYLADPSRSKGNLHPVWAYAHVPHA
jgi:phytoene dehydrogenase-like protein